MVIIQRTISRKISFEIGKIYEMPEGQLSSGMSSSIRVNSIADDLVNFDTDDGNHQMMLAEFVNEYGHSFENETNISTSLEK